MKEVCSDRQYRWTMARVRQVGEWRDNCLDPRLVVLLADLDADGLAVAYAVWWRVYAQKARDMPSNRWGITHAGAAEASDAATRAVFELLKPGRGAA